MERPRKLVKVRIANSANKPASEKDQANSPKGKLEKCKCKRREVMVGILQKEEQRGEESETHAECDWVIHD